MEKTVALHNAVMEGNAPPEGFELRFKRKNGERFDALVYEAPLIDADGQRWHELDLARLAAGSAFLMVGR